MPIKLSTSRLLPLRSHHLLRGLTSTPQTPSRSFFSLPGTPNLTQTLTATRTLPYPSQPLYSLIADVDSYKSFVPYCSRSTVTHWSPPDSTGARWPTQADLHVGWGGFDEKFTSKLTCIPGLSVEAVSGGSGVDDPNASSVFKSLVTRWSLTSLSDSSNSPRTQVHLSIKYHFTNPLYAAVSAAVSDQVANLMIEAFEKQAEHRLNAAKL